MVTMIRKRGYATKDIFIYIIIVDFTTLNNKVEFGLIAIISVGSHYFNIIYLYISD